MNKQLINTLELAIILAVVLGTIFLGLYAIDHTLNVQAGIIDVLTDSNNYLNEVR